ncbi:hypothetical protein EYZ11_004217 [Aspergillus tanneri]|uniref:Uncharacterized protein n=1 Tax=Aspergillus tanneri TaxID=1220188 RepID=A0A4S3JLD5_9EURO|nr:hypothetical protein EYZ11_004217 [Aspergillus tanneri]
MMIPVPGVGSAGGANGGGEALPK